MLTNFTVITLQYIHTSNHHVEHLKLMQCCQLYLKKAGKKLKKGPAKATEQKEPVSMVILHPREGNVAKTRG